MKTSIYLLFLLLLVACGGSKKEEELNNASPSKEIKLSKAQINLAGISVGTALQRELSEVFKLNGIIDVPPQNMVSVCAPLGGYLKSTQLLPGMHVNKGEPIAILEDQQYIELQQNYLMTKARLSAVEKEFNRQVELNKSQAGSDKALEESKADYTSQKILLKSLSEKLKLIAVDPEQLNESLLSRSVRLLSPISGYVSNVNANIGKYVGPTEVLFEIVNPEDIHLALTVFEKDVNRLFIGQTLEAYTNNEPDTKYACEVLLIGKDFNAERNLVVHCHFKNYDKRLLPGMFMNADIKLQKKMLWSVPEEAVQLLNGKQVVFVSTGEGVFKPKEVDCGVSENGFTEINWKDGSKDYSLPLVLTGAYSILMELSKEQEE